MVKWSAIPFLALLAACSGEPLTPPHQQVHGGVIERGHEILQANRYGCVTCHAIPGIKAPSANVGPPLIGMGLRGFIAGRLPNQPTNMVRWISDPQAVDPQTAMPRTGITEEEARHVAAYLYTLRTPAR